jgi:hypothetical protein
MRPTKDTSVSLANGFRGGVIILNSRERRATDWIDENARLFPSSSRARAFVRYANATLLSRGHERSRRANARAESRFSF